MKKIVVGKNCMACGSCTVESDLIITGLNGKALPKGNGVISEDAAKVFTETVDNCPSKALSLISYGSTNKNGNAGMKEIYDKLYKEMYDYQCSRPDEKEYAYPIVNFEGTSALVPASPQHEYESIYSSDKKAEEAGFSEFKAILYDKLKQKIQERLIAHKNYFLYKFSKYEESEDNYFYNINLSIRNKLKDYLEELQEISSNRLELPTDILDFASYPKWVMETGGRVGAFEANFTDKILHNEYNWIYPAGDYKFRINTMETEDYKGKSKWSYDIGDAILELNKDVITAFKEELPPSKIAKLLEDDASDFYLNVRKNLNDKIDQIKIAIDKYCATYPDDKKTNKCATDTERFVQNGKKYKKYMKSRLFESKINNQDMEGIDRIYNVITDGIVDLESPIQEISNDELCKKFISSLDNLYSSAPNLRMRAKNPVEIIFPRENKNNFTNRIIRKAFRVDDRYCNSNDEDTINMFGRGFGGNNAYTLVECNSLDLKGAEEFIEGCLKHRAKWESINPKNHFALYCLLVSAIDVDAYNEKLNEVAEFFYFLQFSSDYVSDWVYAVGEFIRKGVYINKDRFLTKEAKDFFERNN